MVSSHSLVTALLLGAKMVLGQQTLYGQCGGLGWTGPTQCVAGACCKYSNDWYSQCLTGDCGPSGEGGGTLTITTKVGTATTTAATQTSSSNSPGCSKNPTLTSGTKSITVNGKNRQYILRVPKGYDKNRPYKLIFSFHWVGGTMTDVASGGTDGDLWSYYGMQRLANESAILVAPQGLNNGWANAGGEDITFVDQMRQTIENDLCVNQRQRFANGFSYGGAMSFSLACSRARDFRAVAVMSGGQLSGCSSGSDPIAYLGIHGISDGTLNIAGGRTMRDKFVTNNGCTKITPQEPSIGSKTHIKTQYPGCKAGYPVTWIAFDGGHGPAPYDGGGDSGSRTYTPMEMWTFFSQFT